VKPLEKTKMSKTKTTPRPYTLKDIIEQVNSHPSQELLEEDKKFSRLYHTKRVLSALKNSNDGLRRYDIAKKIIISSSILTKTLNNLVDNKMVELVIGDTVRDPLQHYVGNPPFISGKRYLLTERGESARKYIESNLKLEN
jgi:DNA-binding HxlR family transcriptional regulator